MALLRNIAHGLRSLFRRERVDRELDEELRAYQEMAAEEKMKDGMSRSEALRSVRLERGNLEVSKEIVRSGGWEFFLETCWQDLRFGLRLLRKSPGFTAVAVLTLALGIGANTAIFSVANALLLKPLPYPNSDRLAYIWGVWAVDVNSQLQRLEWVQPMKHAQTLEQVAVYDSGEVNMAGAGEPERIAVAEVSANLFSVLGTAAYEGRTFLSKEDEGRYSFIAVISEGLAFDKFGSVSGSIGRVLKLNGKPFTIVGVMPPGFDFPGRIQVWVPLPSDLNNRLVEQNGAIFFSQIARLRTGITPAQARAEMVAIASQPPGNLRDAESAVQVVTMREARTRYYGRGVLLLLASVGFVLLIACADVANLLLARAVGRRKETALRAAFGASRSRLIRQTLSESALLAIMGGLGGFLLSVWGLNALRLLLPPRATEVGADYRVLSFLTAATLGSVLLFGLLPALLASKPNVQDDLQETPAKSASRALLFQSRGLLVISQVAMAFVLLVASGLLIRSFEKLLRVPTGFQTQHLLTTHLILADAHYQKSEQQIAFYRDTLDRVQALPNVLSAAFVEDLPFAETPSTMFILRSKPTGKQARSGAHYMIVSPSYFRTLGIPLLAGRAFTEGDRDAAPKVAIISRSLAQEMWPNENPLGKQLAFYDPKAPWLEVVGVVDDALHSSLDHESIPASTLYVPLWQNARPTAFLTVRTAGDPKPLAGAVRGALAGVDKDEPLGTFVTMTQLLATTTAEPRARASLLAIFAALALILATIGTYGVVSHSVSQRNREIGIRVAMGAGKRDVARLVVGQGAILVTLGIALGLGGALVLTRLLTSFLFEIKPVDPTTYVTACAIFVSIALLASYIPARRAMRVDPVVALRYE